MNSQEHEIYFDELKFTKENLIKDGMYLLFGTEGKFVARFKYRSNPFGMSEFRKELIANHTPASYFKALNNGKAPLDILREVSPALYNKIMSNITLSLE
jgi:hypothetical protein